MARYMQDRNRHRLVYDGKAQAGRLTEDVLHADRLAGTKEAAVEHGVDHQRGVGRHIARQTVTSRTVPVGECHSEIVCKARRDQVA
ncbi:MAG: hypothetical protein CAPSK01_000959 [Candidatus Accumulibacter vicinus]|uniref:Uncharacterized protein n=1 Tax=Candidatus Accumulibacter vicinus TaxID=2954382 RepID=A0A084Y440_9PROT|nr:MAG: hypothetical protein CAPSK01_000959 [Candidatus Accumulibacter vicinus]